MAILCRFLQSGSPSIAVVPEQHFQPVATEPIEVHSEAELARRRAYLQLPEFHITDAGSGDGFDIQVICRVHRWMSLPVPAESGMEPPRCELCEASRNFIDGFSRFQDFVTKRQSQLEHSEAGRVR